jgi:hypothetical protein
MILAKVDRLPFAVVVNPSNTSADSLPSSAQQHYVESEEYAGADEDDEERESEDEEQIDGF